MKKVLTSLFLFGLPFLVNAQSVVLQNPIKIDSPFNLIATVIRFAISFAGIIAMVYIIIGGFYWLTAAGSSDRINKGKGTLLWAFFGLLVVFGSYVFLQVIIQALGA